MRDLVSFVAVWDAERRDASAAERRKGDRGDKVDEVGTLQPTHHPSPSGCSAAGPAGTLCVPHYNRGQTKRSTLKNKKCCHAVAGTRIYQGSAVAAFARRFHARPEWN
ncbi:MAG: hypothetical protein U5K69_27110 [Balneolaceae bacterium]|nr:hypothetical protein [Balneolaceae bacterium]